MKLQYELIPHGEENYTHVNDLENIGRPEINRLNDFVTRQLGSAALEGVELGNGLDG